MTSPPPSYRESPSTTSTRSKLGSADALLQASLLRGSNSVASSLSSASLLRSNTARANNVPSPADALLQASLARGSASVTSASSISSASRIRSSHSQADALLNASLTGSGVFSSSAASTTPAAASTSSLRSRTSTPTALTGPPALSALPHTLSIRSRSQSTKDQGSLTLSQLNEAADKAAHDRLLSQSLVYTDPYGTTSVGLAEKQAIAGYADRKVGSNISPPLSARLTVAESKERLRQMQAQVNQANAQKPPRDTAGVFRKACSTDVLFLLDTTNSMEPYINAARDQIKSIVREIKATFLNETEVRIAVVSYMDHYHREKSIRFLDFVTDPNEVSTFLNGLTTGWGEDFPEDVLGGIRCAINASWKLQTRCVLHIGDAPAHGGELHDYGSDWDHYYQHGSEPHGLTYTPLLQKMVQLRLNYAFLRITRYTDRMVLKFSDIYANSGADVKLLKENTHYGEVKKSQGKIGSSLWSGTGNKAIAELQFEEMPLGTSFSMLQHLVVRSVTRSASLAATRVLSTTSSQQTRTQTGLGKLAALTRQLTMIRESEDEPEPISTPVSSTTSLEKVSPQWTAPSWFKDLLTLDGFCPDTGVHEASTLNEMMAADENVKLSVTQLAVRKRPRPFAEGTMRLAYYALTAHSTDKFVVKTFKAAGNDAMAQMIEDMRAQALCKAFALEFNSLLKEQYAIDFIVTTSWQVKARQSTSDSHLSLEPFIDGDYVKYNSNAGYVKEQDPSDPFNDAAQAYSHFTFERSFGTFMVTDLQGCGHVLTDPSIQAKDPNRFKLSPTNQGIDGFKFFFATHVCNTVCTKLGLQSKKEMFIDGKWEFRELWPTVDNTVFCSNKLCRKIIRVTNAQTSPKFPDCHWCLTCWPQLQSTTSQWHCEEPGPDHVFDVSLFYYQSQGQPAPRKCPAHLEKDTTGFTAAATGSMLFKRMNSMNQRSSTSGRAW